MPLLVALLSAKDFQDSTGALRAWAHPVGALIMNSCCPDLCVTGEDLFICLARGGTWLFPGHFTGWVLQLYAQTPTGKST